MFILFDDVGYGDFFEGHTRIFTPNIDRLAAQGVRFEQYYVNSSICSPSRASILTGRHPQRSGILNALAASSERTLPPNLPTVADRLRKLGYTSASIGKWHVGDLPENDPVHRGFDESIVFDAADGYTDPLLRFDGDLVQTVPGHLTDLLIDYAEAFVTRAQTPYFLNLWLYDAHTATAGGETQYEPLPRWAARYDDTEHGRYAAHISGADEGIGRLLATIDALDPDGNTLVVVTSDNGSRWTDNGHNADFRGSKGRLLEGGIRVPLIMNWAGVLPEGRTDTLPAQSIDLAPTLLELAGGAVDANAFDGTSIAERLLTGQQATRTPTLYWNKGTGPYYDNERGIGERLALRQGQWKLLFVPENGRTYLYDLHADPFERTNRADQQPDLVDALWARYRDWHLDVGALDGVTFALSGDAGQVGDTFTFGTAGGTALAKPDSRLRVHDGSFSVSAWVRVDAFPADQAIVAAKAGAWRLAIDAAGRLVGELDGVAFDRRSAARQTLVSTASLVPGQWTHVVLTTYGTSRSPNQTRLYLDGVLEGEGAELAEIVSNDNPASLGNDQAGKRPLIGAVRQPRFFTVPLSAAEIQDLVAAGP
ncbi:MAG: sulfatase-like hydrolase/transferase [Pseudomonadota bacterium]